MYVLVFSCMYVFAVRMYFFSFYVRVYFALQITKSRFAGGVYMHIYACMCVCNCLLFIAPAMPKKLALRLWFEMFVCTNIQIHISV
jgi:hypothetical protein